MIKLTEKEVEFIKGQGISRVSTISDKGWPQTTPVLHAFDGRNIYFATDFDTKKYENLKKNKRISFVADVYDRQPQGIAIQGTAKIIEKGDEFAYGYNLIEKRHEYYRANPFKEGEAPIIRITPLRHASWGI